MTSPTPTFDQMRHLIGHTEHGVLTVAESTRLRAAFEHPLASQAGLRRLLETECGGRVCAGQT